MWVRAVTVLVLLSSCSVAQRAVQRNRLRNSAPQEDRYSTVLLHNSDITVRRLNIPPQGESHVSASNHDYLLISIGTNSITLKGQNSFDMTLGPGEMQVIDGGWQHAIVNTTNSEALLFMIEPMHEINPKAPICGLGAKTCSEHRFGETAHGTYNQYVQFETDTTKLLRLTIGPGVATHLHDDKNKHLIVALTPFVGHNDGQSFDLKAGDMRWIPGGFDELGNDGTAEVRVLILELR